MFLLFEYLSKDEEGKMRGIIIRLAGHSSVSRKSNFDN